MFVGTILSFQRERFKEYCRRRSDCAFQLVTRSLPQGRLISPRAPSLRSWKVPYRPCHSSRHQPAWDSVVKVEPSSDLFSQIMKTSQATWISLRFQNSFSYASQGSQSTESSESESKVGDLSWEELSPPRPHQYACVKGELYLPSQLGLDREVKRDSNEDLLVQSFSR